MIIVKLFEMSFQARLSSTYEVVIPFTRLLKILIIDYIIIKYEQKCTSFPQKPLKKNAKDAF